MEELGTHQTSLLIVVRYFAKPVFDLACLLKGLTYFVGQHKRIYGEVNQCVCFSSS